MSHADPISDMLTRIRNAASICRLEVSIKASSVCRNILQVMQQQGYIQSFDFIETADKQGLLRIQLKYGPLGEKLIHEVKRCSKPSCRVYCKVDQIPSVMGGLGIAILSTSQGLLSDQQCRERNLGGELICTIC